MFQREIAQCYQVISFDGYVFDPRFQCRASIARGDENLVHQGRLRYFPSKGVFAATAADDEYIHPLKNLKFVQV